MKKLLFTLALTLLLCFVLVGVVSARSAYLEEIPEEWLYKGDTVTHFIVFDGNEYYNDATTINAFNTEAMDAALLSVNVSKDSSETTSVSKDEIGAKYLTKLVFPKTTTTGSPVTTVDLNSLKGNATYFWGKVTPAKLGAIVFPSTMTSTSDMNEAVGNLRYIDFGENSQLKNIPGWFCQDANKLTCVKNFPKDLDTIGAYAFNRSVNAFHGVLYINATTVSGSAFNNAITHLDGIVFGPKVKSIGNQTFCVRASETGLGDPKVKFVEFQCPVSTLSLGAIGNDKGSFNFAPKSGNPRSPYSSLQCIVISNEADLALIEANGYTTIQELNTNICFDENYSNTFVTAHNYTYTYSYESLTSAGAKTGTCSCGATVVEALPAIFECYGYSIATYGEGAITVGFRVDLKALTAYEEMLGYTVSFGIVAVGTENLGGKSPLDENGNAVALEKGLVIKAELDRANALFDGKVIGLNTESQKSTQLIMCGYAHITDGEGNTVSVSYLQKSDAEGLVSTSYNDLLAVNQ